HPPAKGCAVTFVEPVATHRVDYVHDIAPVVAAKCLSCHRPRGVAASSLTDFEKVRGWARMIREVVRTRRMPPWHADPRYGHFVNDIGLTPGEARLLVHWVENGMPRGDGADPLPDVVPPPGEWQFGTPDMVITLPTQTLPASGILPYRVVTQPIGVDEDVWVRAVEVRPGNPQALHHLHAYLQQPAALTAGEPQWPVNWFARYGHGSPIF